MTESQGQVTASVATGATNILVQAGEGRLSAVLLTGTSGGVLQFIDNAAGGTSGPLIGYVASGSTIGTFKRYDAPYRSGLTIVQTGGSGTQSTFTLVYTTG